jgi:hypothetical protein
MKARRFNPEGLKLFEEYILKAKCALRDKAQVDFVPENLLFDPAFSQPTDFELPEEMPIFPDKMSIGSYVSTFIPEDKHELARLDKEMWSWLAARFFDQITNGRTKIKETRAYIAGLTFQEFYRHLILGPYYIFYIARDNPDRVRILLYDDPTTMNEVMVQFGSYQTLMQNKEMQSVIQRLYFDEKLKRSKRGSGGKEAGTPRRLMDFFRQIELNYDLTSITEAKFWEMIPDEFSKFKT